MNETTEILRDWILFRIIKLIKKSMSVLRNYDANHSTMIYDDDRT